MGASTKANIFSFSKAWIFYFGTTKLCGTGARVLSVSSPLEIFSEVFNFPQIFLYNERYILCFKGVYSVLIHECGLLNFMNKNYRVPKKFCLDLPKFWKLFKNFRLLGVKGLLPRFCGAFFFKNNNKSRKWTNSQNHWHSLKLITVHYQKLWPRFLKRPF